jgi:hypothetical protein
VLARGALARLYQLAEQIGDFHRNT